LKVAVVGGTGALGSSVVAELAARGDEVRVLSRSPAAALPDGVLRQRADLATGEGLREGLDGVEVVVDASNALKEARNVLVAGTERLLRAETETGVGHHVAVSIVGCDRVPIAYYRAKVAQERAVESGAVPWSLLRATQFHSLLDWAFGRVARFRLLPTGAARLQPIEAPIVATRLADAAHGGPSARLPDVAGPQVATLTELARAWRRARGRRLLPLRIPTIGKVGGAVRDGALCDPAAAVEGPSFEAWLAGQSR
jgi:uncharacterized protein YbjT (DUF2867 family)